MFTQPNTSENVQLVLTNQDFFTKMNLINYFPAIPCTQILTCPVSLSLFNNGYFHYSESTSHTVVH